MGSSTGSRSTAASAPKPCAPSSTSRSPARSGSAESAGSRLLFEPRRDLAVPLPVELRARDGAARDAYATNVSSSGLCLHLRAPLPVGELVALAFDLPDASGTVEARGRVTWSEDVDPAVAPRFFEVGVRLEVVGDADAARLRRFVDLCDPAGAAPAAGGARRPS